MWSKRVQEELPEISNILTFLDILSEMYRLILLTLAVSFMVNGGKVLVFPLDGSHWVNMIVIIEELYARGHDVTMVWPSNSWYIKPDSPYYKSIRINITAGFDPKSFGSYMHMHALQMVEQIFEDEALLQSLRDAKYDLVLTDPAIGGGVLLGHRLGLPLVYNVRWTIQGEGHQAITPSPLSYIPTTGSMLTDRMTFMQRVRNIIIYILTRTHIWFMIEPNYKPFVHRHFGKDVHYMELFQSADIWLMRNDFTFEFPRPTMVKGITQLHLVHCLISRYLCQNYLIE
uniref:UDP glucuronosyltransferase 5 family, polypeptide D1 n=1 Tax=Poecilia reticulata TaxID=8081 RepID=A0A3P9PAH2_POERE